MVTYIISPVGNSELRIDPDDFSKKMLNKWPGINIQRVILDNDPYILRWSIELIGHRQLGGLQENRQAVSVEDFPSGVADFALWYRSVIHLDYKLSLYDDDLSNQMELKKET